MLWFLVILLFIVVNSAHIAARDRFAKDYLSKEKTNVIKGIFVILVVFKHYSSYADFSGIYDEPIVVLNQHLGQMIVAMFLFYSGYGIMESISKKGFAYIKAIPSRRLVKVWGNFALAVLMYLLLSVCIGEHYHVSTILLAFTGWRSVGNSNWYMFAIMALYILTFFFFFCSKFFTSHKKYYFSALLLTLLTVILVYAEMKAGQPSWFYNTCILFPLGTWYSLLKERVEKIAMKNDIIYSFLCLVMICCYIIAWNNRGNYGIEGYSIWAVIFTLTIILFTMKISIQSEILGWFGEHVFGIYILQRIPMIVLNYFGLTATHKYASLVVVIACTVFLTQIFDLGTERIWKRVYNSF